ncbi:MAG: nucleotidyltransferase domain-containing protein [Candidatus Micrarchaeota archaeon]
MLKALITSKTKRKILELLFMNSKKRFYLREICRKTNAQTNAVWAELSKLERAGILTSQREANMVYYQVNALCPIFGELRGIIAKTCAISEALKGALGGKKEIRLAFIYGSFAKGNETPSSDIDLMVIGNPNPEKFSKSIAKLENSYGREINYSIYPAPEFEKKAGSGFMAEVLRGRKIMLIGDENELERFAKK